MFLLMCRAARQHSLDGIFVVVWIVIAHTPHLPRYSFTGASMTERRQSTVNVLLGDRQYGAAEMGNMFYNWHAYAARYLILFPRFAVALVERKSEA